MATFGKTDIGGTADALPANYEIVCKYTLGENGDVSKLTMYVDGSPNGAAQIKGIIYSDSSGPSAFLGATNESSIAAGQAAGWIDLTFASPVSLTAGDYWLGIHAGGTTAFNAYYSAVGTRDYKSQSYASGQTNPYGTPTGSDTKTYSLYATYTPSAASVTGSSSLEIAFGVSSSGHGPAAADVVDVLTGLVDDTEIIANERAADFGDYVGIPSLPAGIPTRPVVKVGRTRSIVDGFGV